MTQHSSLIPSWDLVEPAWDLSVTHGGIQHDQHGTRLQAEDQV